MRVLVPDAGHRLAGILRGPAPVLARRRLHQERRAAGQPGVRTDQETIPFFYDAMQRAQDETGHAKLFSRNITADDHYEMCARADFALEVNSRWKCLARMPTGSPSWWMDGIKPTTPIISGGMNALRLRAGCRTAAACDRVTHGAAGHSRGAPVRSSRCRTASSSSAASPLTYRRGTSIPRLRASFDG